MQKQHGSVGRGDAGSCYARRMSLDQIRTFVAVAEAGSMTAAASRLHLTQPPLSRQLASLEDELRTRLFERQARGMRLMPAGEAFLVHARRILAAVDDAVVAVVAVTAGPGAAGETDDTR